MFYRRSETVARLMQFAYDVSPLQVLGGPDWIRRFSFEINARAAGTPPLADMRLMVQALLEQRFALVVRREQRDMRHYVLMVEKPGTTGPRLRTCAEPDNPPPPTPVRMPAGAAIPIMATCTSISSLAGSITGVMGAPVIDRTGLAGQWTYDVTYRDSEELTGRMKELAEIANVPSLSVALREQLGMTLEERRGPVDVIVVESVEAPTEN